MDVTNLVLNLKSKITDDTLDQQMISKAIQLLELGAVIHVTSFQELPDVAANVGRLYFVEFDGLYWSTGEYWVPIVNTTVNSAWAWGSNSNGRLGDGTTTNRSSPVRVIGEFSDWCQASAGGLHSLAVRTNGSLWAWGSNANGSLGDNTVAAKTSPVSVVGGFSDWCEASAGGDHSLAIRTNGTLWAWGSNINGRLGDGTTSSRRSPVSVVGEFSDWCQASAGTAHSLAVRTNGTLWAWGVNAIGTLGDNSITSRSSPVSVVGGFTDWCQASAGESHSLAVRSNGTLWAWGCNTTGQLGDNSITSRRSPVSVVGGFSDWCQASAGYHSLAVRSNGTLWAWGCNTSGQLGDNSITGRSSPVSVVGGFSDWCQASVGYFSLAVRSNGTLWAWGSNSGQLGDNTTTNRSSPVSVVGGFSDWWQVSTGGSHSIAIRGTQA
jgi:alpha-tubulin suppressor-like RCC1 family protein